MPENREMFLDELSPEQQQQAQANLTSTPAQPEGFDPVDILSPQGLAELSINSKGKDFDPVEWGAANPDKLKDPNTVAKLADTYGLLKQRGFKFRDIDPVEATKSVLKIFPAMAKWGGTALELGVVNPLARAVLPDQDPASEREFEEIRAKKSAELVSSTELGVTGLGEMVKKGGEKISRLFGFSKSPNEQEPHERVEDFWSAVGMAQQRQKISEGKGTAVSAVLGGVIADMEKGGTKVDPEVVNELAAGDPVTFLAFPGGFKVVAASGKTLGQFASKAQAVQLVTRLRQAQRAAARTARAEQATVGSLERIKGTVGAMSPTGQALAQPILTEAGQIATQASRAAGAAEQGLAAAEQAVAASPAARLVQGVQDVGSRLVEPLGRARDALGSAVTRGTDIALGAGAAVTGAGLRTFEGVGKGIAAFIPPIATPRALRVGYELAGKAGKQQLGVAKQLVSGAREGFSPSLRLLSDVARGAPTVAAGAGRGFLMLDVPLAAVTSETPAETAHMPVFGAFLGAVGAAPRAAGRVVQGQTIAPRAWGSEAAMRDYRSFSGLDQAHKFSVESLNDPAKTQWLAGIREFLQPTKAQLYLVSDPAMLRDALKRYAPGAEESWYDAAAQQRAVTLSMVDDAGVSRKVVLLRDANAAPHEAFHPFQDVLGERAMQQIDQLVYDEYSPVWDQLGENYVRQFAGSKGLAEYQSRGEGWQEAILDITSGGKQWREQLSPEQIDQVANLYLSREISAEVGDAVLRSSGPSLLQNPSFPGKLARVLGKTMVGLGMEPFAGVETEGQGVPLRMEPTQAIQEAFRTGIEGLKVEQRRPDVGGTPPYPQRGGTRSPAPPPGTAPAEPAARTTPAPEPATAAAEARAIAAEAPDTPTTRGQRSPREVLGEIAENIASGEGLIVDYRSAPGQPAGAVTSNRDARRAIIEAFRDMPQSARALWEKQFFPDRVIRTQAGKIQVQGWAPEVFAANAHKMAKSLSEGNAADLSPYPIDPKTGTFTEQGWRQLHEDVNVFVRNQLAGQTGSGQPLVVPAETTARGFSQPARRGEAGGELSQDRADFINALFGVPIPKTPRIGQVFPRNIVGQEVSEATIPGRTSVPVEPRAPFAGARAEELGIAGREIKEVNPFRAELAKRGIKPSLIEAVQRLNLESIADVSPTGAAVPQFRGVEFTLQAGFQPKPREPRAIKSAAIRITGPEGERIVEGFRHADAYEKAFGEEIIPRDVTVVDGFTANDGSFLDRNQAFKRAQELQQIPIEREFPSLESEKFAANRKFQPQALEDTVQQVRDADMPALRELVKNTSGRFGGGLTGFAYDLGAGLKEPSQLRTLDEARAFHTTEAKKALTTKDFDAAATHGNKAQLFREAIEFSTGSGSAGLNLERNYPGFEPPLRGARFAPRLSEDAHPFVKNKKGEAKKFFGPFKASNFPKLEQRRDRITDLLEDVSDLFSTEKLRGQQSTDVALNVRKPFFADPKRIVTAAEQEAIWNSSGLADIKNLAQPKRFYDSPVESYLQGLAITSSYLRNSYGKINLPVHEILSKAGYDAFVFGTEKNPTAVGVLSKDSVLAAPEPGKIPAMFREGEYTPAIAERVKADIESLSREMSEEEFTRKTDEILRKLEGGAAFTPKEREAIERLRGRSQEKGGKPVAEPQDPQAEKKALERLRNSRLIGGQFQPATARMADREHITAAAIRTPEGEVFEGLFHGRAYENAGISPVEGNRPIAMKAIEEGFVTSEGRFVGREEAFQIGKAAQQIEVGSPAESTAKFLSLSEDRPALEAFSFQESRRFQTGEKDTRKTGLAFKKFFSDVTTGKFGKSDVPFEPVLDVSEPRHESFINEQVKHTGNFDEHISKSIPTFKETQIRKGQALVEALPEGAVVLDIGASEGSLMKTITVASEGKIKTVSLDPNPDMAKFFRGKSKVEGAEYVEEAFLRGFEDEGKTIPAYDPEQRFDAIHESMAFQFISPERGKQIAEVKRLLKPDGVFLTEEKVRTEDWAANEVKKDRDWKDKYFTKEELAAKDKTVGFQQSKNETKAVGMVDNMAKQEGLESVLRDNFEHVVQYWDSGNFKGYAASDSLAAVQRVVESMGDLNSEFSTVETPRVVSPERGAQDFQFELGQRGQFQPQKGQLVPGKRRDRFVRPESRGVPQRRAPDWRNERDLDVEFSRRVDLESLRNFVKDDLVDFAESDPKLRKLIDENYRWNDLQTQVENLYGDLSMEREYVRPIQEYLEQKAPELAQSIKDFSQAINEGGRIESGGELSIRSGDFLFNIANRFARGKLMDLGLASDEANTALRDWPGEGREMVKPLDKPLADWIEKYVYREQPFTTVTDTASFQPAKRRGKKALENSVGDESIEVVHYSSRGGLNEISPSFFGKGKATRTDLRGGNKSFFFVKGSDLGQDVNLFGAGGLVTYESSIPGKNIYDLRAGKDDPIGWRHTLNREEADDNVKKAGYSGIMLDTADGRTVVAMFEPVPVTERTEVSAPGIERAFQPAQRGETEGLPGLDIPREVLSASARASMTRQELRQHFPEAVVPRASGEKISSDIVGSPLYKRAGDEAAAVEQFAKRLVEFAREYESAPEYQAGSKWYSDFTPRLKKTFGKDAQLMAELLAATSPNTGVETNFGYAFDALKSLRSGRFDKIIPKFEEGLSKMEDGSWESWYNRELKAGNIVNPPAEPTPAAFLARWIDKHDLKPKQSNGKLYGQHSIPVLQVFARRWLDLNRGPKVRNFVENLLGQGDGATIDVWASRTMRWAGYEGFSDRWRILPENATGISDADFAFSQKAFRAAAEQLGMKPSDLQGALWFAEKRRWADNGWGRLDLGDFREELKKVPMLEKGYQQRLKFSGQAGKKRAPEAEQLGLAVEPRFK